MTRRSIAILISLCLISACSRSSATWTAESVTESAVADLSDHLDVPEAQIIVVTPASPVTWSTGAIGCAQSGVQYQGNQVAGFMLILGFFDTTYPYHQGGSEPPFLCPEPTE